MQTHRLDRFATRAAVVALVATMFAASRSDAFDVFWTVGTGSWNTGSNWDSGFPPDQAFEEVGNINNGGTATLNTAAASDAAGLVLGLETGDTGSLHIQSGGSLGLVASTGGTTGTLNIGLNGGSGVVQVDGGGSLSTTLVDMNNGSVLEIGGGTGTASVMSTGGMWLAGRTITHGSGHTFSAATFVNFEGGSEYVLDLKSNTHTKLTAGGTIANVQGALVVQTSGGYTPSLGASWDILEGATITGGGFDIDTSAVSLAPGSGYRTRLVDNGASRTMQLYYDSLATLLVNTSTGAMSLVSESGNAIDVIGYSVTSGGGALNPTNFNGLANQSFPGWQVAGTPSANAFDELNATGSLALDGSAISLGNAFAAPTEFGVSPDINFEYAVAGELQPTTGIVKMSGVAAVNNLLLKVDPATGEGQLKNSSTFDIEILGYSIVSNSGSLNETTWTSLADDSTPGWDEAASDATGLSELVPTGSPFVMTAGQSFSMGDMFTVGGSKDLTIDFIYAPAGVGEIRQGVVGSIGPY